MGLGTSEISPGPWLPLLRPGHINKTNKLTILITVIKVNVKRARRSIKGVLNRPFASATGPLYQSKCSAFDTEMIFHF